MSGAFLIIFMLFWSGIVLLFDGFMVRGIYKQYESARYSNITGVITQSEVKSHHTSKGGTSYNAVIQYKYEIGGQNFYGDKVRLGITSGSSYAAAEATVNAHPVGASVSVFYNPANPQEALLSPGINGSDFMLALFLTPFNMVMLGFWIWIGSWLRERLFKPAAGGVKIIADGMTTRIRLPQFPALVWGLGVTGALGFISIFAVGFSTKMEPPIPLILSVIAIVYAAGLAVYLWQQQKINSGIDDLIIHDSAQMIELPLTFSRKQRVTVNAADIGCLSVEKIEHRSSKGGISYTYAPTLRLGQTGAAQKLADWSDKLKADEFAEWLRSRLGANIPATFNPPISGNEDANKSTGAPTIPAEFLRPEHSKIRINDGPEGREFYFPAARNIGTALFAILFLLIFCGEAAVTFHLQAPVLFPIAFGLFGVLMFCGSFSLWFKSSRVTINSTNVRATNGYLFFSRTREFSTGDVARFSAISGMQSGSKIFYNLKLITRAGDNSNASQAQFQPAGQLSPLLRQRFKNLGGATIAGRIANLAEANWLVQEMTGALGRNL